MATNYSFTFGIPVGNSLQVVVQVVDFSGNFVNVSNVSSIALTVYAPGVVPLSGPVLAVVPISPNSLNSWLGYYNAPVTATIGTYTAVVQGYTVSSFNFLDFSKFRIFPIDA